MLLALNTGDLSQYRDLKESLAEQGRALTDATREDFDCVTELLEEGRIQVRPMITHRAKLEALPETMPVWCGGEAGVIKAMIHLDR